MPPDWTFDWYEHTPGNESVRVVVPNRSERRRAARKRKRR